MALAKLPKIRIIPPGYTSFENEEEDEETGDKLDPKVDTSDVADGTKDGNYPDLESDLLEPSIALGQFSKSQLSLNLDVPDPETGDIINPHQTDSPSSSEERKSNAEDSKNVGDTQNRPKRVNPFVKTMRPPEERSFGQDSTDGVERQDSSDGVERQDSSDGVQRQDSSDGVQRQDSSDGVQRFVTQPLDQGPPRDGGRRSVTRQPSQDWRVGSPADQGPYYEWYQDTLGCWKNPKICAYGMFCGPCLFCRNVSDLGSSGCSWWCLGLLFPVTIAMRSTARAQLGVQGSYMDDVVTSILCSSCVNCQVASQIKQHKERGYKST